MGGIVVAFSLFSEFLPVQRRGFWMLAIEYFWTVGTLVVSRVTSFTDPFSNSLSDEKYSSSGSCHCMDYSTHDWMEMDVNLFHAAVACCYRFVFCPSGIAKVKLVLLFCKLMA